MSLFDLIPWRRADPHPVSRLRTQLDRVLDEFFEDCRPRQVSGDDGQMVPVIDVAETDDGYTVRAELAGLDEDDYEITFDDGVLILRGDKKEEVRDDTTGKVSTECQYGMFERRLLIGEGVDPDRVSASYDKGVVTIELPKTEQARTQQHHPLSRLRVNLDRVIEEFFEDGSRMAFDDDTQFVPLIDVVETATGYVVRVELPGMEPDDIELILENGSLILRGEKTEETRDQTDASVCTECHIGQFERRLSFGDEVDPDDVSASYDNGVVTVELTKTAEGRKKGVEIPIQT